MHPLTSIDPREAVLIVGPSKRKSRGGRLGAPARAGWSPDLLRAREDVLARAKVEQPLLLPAWRRYDGTFYRAARETLAEAADNGRLIVLSGGYGLLRADEPIAYYDRKLKLRDWPDGVLERALNDKVRAIGAKRVVSFVSASADYAKLVRRTAWEVQATLVTMEFHGGGAQIEVPRRLARAFTAFWAGGDFPPGTVVEELS
ncbi:YaaA family protein [Amycolatopsis sp. K13G38]|uniref:YaaA family protein n=1 Tax=Amycolatopsis acididurans TaxID=2724524 RepID=A0ABX1IYU9_9PSEU|nr:YaaA family protein [Amycolatopsis acididurans]NKQ51280.1 YaaA family protein [Amycolatopsis acididurans]